MELHNTVEDIVIARVNEIFIALDKEGNAENFCTCNQCKMDIICYALNRMWPRYIVSSRGAARAQWDGIEKQQQLADITALIHQGFRQVNHNQRPNFSHVAESETSNSRPGYPAFNIPTIMGRLLDGNNFAPISNVDLELFCGGELVRMKDGNWQNPCHLVLNTEGTFSFWPVAVKADKINEPKVFEFSLRVSAKEFDTLTHFFKIAVTSENQEAASFTLERTFKLPDLYMFHPGEAEKNEQ